MSTRERPNAGLEFRELEWLDQKIVGAPVQAFDAVGQCVPCCHKQDRNVVTPLAQSAKYFYAGLVWKAPVQEQDLKVVDLIFQGRLCLTAVADPIHAVALIAQSADQTGANHGVIFGKQNSHGLGPQGGSIVERET